MLNVELYNSKLNKLKLGIKDGTEIIFKISSNVFGDSNDEKNFPYESLLTNAQVSMLLKAFANDSVANIKF